MLSVAAVSCGDSGDITPEQSLFSVRNSLIAVDAAGGAVEIAYSVVGPAEGLVPEVTAGEPWIKLTGKSSGRITLDISANDTGADRLGNVVLSGENVKDLVLHISQSKVSDSSPVQNSFVVDVKNIGTSSLDVEVTPVNPAAYYYTNVLTETTYSSFSEKDLVAEYAKNILYYCSIYEGAQPRNFLYQGYFNTAESENVSLDLRDDTDYRVFAFDLDFDEQQNPVASGRVESIKVRTARASQVQMNFSFEKKSGAVVTVTPSSSTYSYICGIASKSQWNEYKEKKDAARDYIDIMKQYGALENMIYYGPFDVDFTYLVEDPGVYVVYAVGYRNSDSDRGLTTDIQYREFTF